MNALLWLLPALPAGAGGLLLLVRRAARTVSLAVAALTLALAVYAAVARPSVDTRLLFRAGLAVDGLSAVMVVTVAAVALAVLVFAAGEWREARFHGLMLIFTGAMLVTVTATDLVLLLMAWEVMGAMSYALIGYRWRDPVRVRSGAVAFLTTRAGDLGLYVAAGAVVAAGSPPVLDALAGVSGGWRDLVAAGIVLAALGKAAQLPFSFWLSRAMDGPSPVSALLHSATMVAAGAYLLLRVQPLLAATGWAADLVAWAGAVTALLLGGVALAQRDLKRLLAASTCAQLGFMVAGAGVAAIAGGAAHLVAHAAVKSLLFLVAGVWLSALGTRDLSGLGGAGRRCPVVGGAFAVGAVALAGVPPLALWATKEAIVVAVREPALHVTLLAAALTAAAYSAKALVAVWRPGRSGGTASRPAGGVTGWEKAPIVVLAVAAAGFGVVAVPGVFAVWARVTGDADASAPSPGGLVLSGLPALAVVAAVLLVRPRAAPRGRAQGFFADWLHLERAALWLVARPVMAVAGALARFDDHVLDAAVHRVARAGRAVAGVAGRFDDGTVDAAVEAVPRAGTGAARIVRAPFETGVDGVVRAVAAAAGRLGALARRPQTGQVHVYFAQAAVALTVLTVLAVALAALR
ncbi:NADH-quinone oxidoreductase subunit L [Nonomuraea terrae]|uniref:NADH-quinone oxidoreductase subunit L n=1 Tax=Nonomuraea terrae TaxID=2530383 RepID=UPI00379CC14D